MNLVNLLLQAISGLSLVCPILFPVGREDIACHPEAAFVTVHPSHLQCCCYGGQKHFTRQFALFHICFRQGYLSNQLVWQTLPIFLDNLVTAWGAILISVTLILLFGEIIPQSVCTRYGLAIGATVAPFVRLLVWICFPVSYPISKLLDFLLGDGHAALFRRAELKTLVNLHGNEGIGNGIPLGAVVTTPEIAQVLTHHSYFNTFGGNPVCTAAGHAVLKVIEKIKAPGGCNGLHNVEL